MTTPTQAHIEPWFCHCCKQMVPAAQVGETALFGVFEPGVDKSAAQVGKKTKTQEAYEAGLEDGRAAAQVGERDKFYDNFHGDAAERAAQVGEQRQEGMAWITHETKLRTIERCARVCDEAANDPRATKEYRYFCINMAAAIRRLRDET